MLVQTKPWLACLVKTQVTKADILTTRSVTFEGNGRTPIEQKY